MGQDLVTKAEKRVKERARDARRLARDCLAFSAVSAGVLATRTMLMGVEREMGMRRKGTGQACPKKEREKRPRAKAADQTPSDKILIGTAADRLACRPPGSLPRAAVGVFRKHCVTNERFARPRGCKTSFAEVTSCLGGPCFSFQTKAQRNRLRK